jgi:hypothetical protein
MLKYNIISSQVTFALAQFKHNRSLEVAVQGLDSMAHPYTYNIYVTPQRHIAMASLINLKSQFITLYVMYYVF